LTRIHTPSPLKSGWGGGEGAAHGIYTCNKSLIGEKPVGCSSGGGGEGREGLLSFET